MSTTTISINPQEIQQIFQPRTSNPSYCTPNSSHLWKLAQKANKLAEIIEARWEMISPQEQEMLKVFASELIEPPSGIQGIIKAFVSRVYLLWNLAKIVFNDEQDAFIEYFRASQRLVNAILSAIEREDAAYQQALSKALEEVLTDSETKKAMTGEEACEWIREISYQAIEEL